ncbi:MAG TPA: phosphodiester glycosidase family protein [Pyrinomonadaceae bacterium]|nr:phosphodiester glycosidase family protein [Pyrinomonadaceae bacterium]
MKTSPLLILVLFALSAWSGCSRGTSITPPPAAVHEGSETRGGTAPRFTTIRVDVRTERIELFLRDDAGHTFKRFDRLESWLASRNERLRFAMNAGMFQPDLSPVGLLVQDGQQVSPLNLSDGTGNFFLKPNGVFFVSESGPRIVESTEYPALARGVRLATQSGPLLVRNGVLHPAVDAASTSRLVRNGVGISGDTIMFVISEEPVNFYEMAIYFRDELHCPDALYLDGVVSSLYSTDLQRRDSRADLGPIIGIVE